LFSELKDIMGLVAAALTTAAFFPQVMHTRRCGGENLSYAMLGIFLTGVTLWLVYGIASASLPIVVANILTAAQVLAILIFKRTHRRTAVER
jgi:MtN3 and saliva related transmembrane protein